MSRETNRSLEAVSSETRPQAGPKGEQRKKRKNARRKAWGAPTAGTRLTLQRSQMPPRWAAAAASPVLSVSSFLLAPGVPATCHVAGIVAPDWPCSSHRQLQQRPIFAPSASVPCPLRLWGPGPRLCNHSAVRRRTGDAPVPALFALGQHAALAEARRHLRPDELLLADLDDIYVITTAERAHGKARLWNASGREPPGVRELGSPCLVALGVPCVAAFILRARVTDQLGTVPSSGSALELAQLPFQLRGHNLRSGVALAPAAYWASRAGRKFPRSLPGSTPRGVLCPHCWASRDLTNRSPRQGFAR